MRQLTIISIIGSILTLIGCSGHDKKMTDEKTEEMRKMLEDFEKRPIHKTLTVDILKNTKDENLEQTIIDNIQTMFNEDFSNQEEIVRGLSAGQKAIYMTWILEAEVNNGGFNQYYFNSSGQLADLGENSFRLIGAVQFANLVGQANSIYDEIKDDLEKFNDGTIESFSKSYEGNPLNDLDTKFYDLYKVEPLDKIKIQYIKDNVKEFVK
jgi:hypothetical protein